MPPPIRPDAAALPLAQLRRRAENAKTPLERHLTAYYLWECSLKLLGSAAVVDYAELGPADPAVAERLRNLARPAVGHWWEFARLLVPALADRGVAGYPAVKDTLLGRTRDDCPHAAGLDAALIDVLEGKRSGRATVRLAELFDRLVRYRNYLIGHGAPGQLRDDFNARMAQTLLAGTTEVLARLDVLAGRRLLYVESVRPARGAWLVQRYELAGEVPARLEAAEVPRDPGVAVPDEGTVHLWDPAGPPSGGLRSLHPLVLFEPEAGEVLFLNARRGRARAEYLCYTTGRVTDRADLGAERRALLARALSIPVSPADEEAWAARSHADEPAGEPPAGAPARLLGEFELLSELGRGGMGIVYRAWQPSLRRQVALKKLLPSADLERAEDRFRREIRALGRVEHPHLVKVYTSGSDGEDWYYAMELVEGAALSAVCEALAARSSAAAVDLPTWRASVSTACDKARKGERPLSDPPPPAGPAPEPAGPAAHAPSGTRAYVRQVVELMAGVAEAAHALHEAGVVHRDVKPGNVMVGPDGTRATLMDLGLAQVADEVDGKLTRTRQFVGTLRYASPEQVLAVGGVDRRADVYGLGATLWEVLALRPLFGATDRTPTPLLMLDIQQREPDRLRGCNPAVGRDLEAVVHRCLEKRPERRYQTAKALAEDLRRALAGEPVVARPVSSLDRGLKWVRRHPTAAGAMTAVALALLIGSAVSIAFGLEARKEAIRANDEANRATGEATRADRERDDAVNARNDLYGALATTLLGPIRADSRVDPLTPYEVDAFWELASRRGTPVSYRFLEEATLTPRACKQLESRADFALHAAIGLDPELRDRVDRHLVARFKTPDITSEHRTALAFACSRWRSLSPCLADLVSAALVDAMIKTTDRRALGSLAEGLAVVAGRMPPDDAAKALADAMARATDSDAERGLAEGLAAVAGRMPPDAAARALADAMAKTRNPTALGSLAEGLAAVAGRMPPDAAARALADAMAKTRNPTALGSLAEGLAVVAGRMHPDDAAKALADAMARATAPDGLGSLARGLAAVAGRMPPDDAATTCAAAAKALADAMARATLDWRALGSLAEGLAAVAGRMHPDDAAKALADAMARTAAPDALRNLAEGLAAVAGRMPPDAAAKALADAMTKTHDLESRRLLAEGLVAVAGRMPPDDAAKALADAMARIGSSDGLGSLARGLAAVAGRMCQAPIEMSAIWPR